MRKRTFRIPLVAIFFYVVAIGFGLLPWITQHYDDTASQSISSTQSLRSANVLFSPNNQIVNAGENSTATIELDTNGIPVENVDLTLQTLSGTLAIVQLTTLQSGCKTSASMVELTCEIPQNTDATQLLPLATITLTGTGMLSVAPGSTIYSPVLGSLNRLRTFPDLIISNSL